MATEGPLHRPLNERLRAAAAGLAPILFGVDLAPTERRAQ